MSVKVIVFGSIPLATKMLKYFLSRDGVEVAGVVCERSHVRFRNHYFNEPSVYTVALERGVPVYALNEVAALAQATRLTLGFSGRFNRILSKETLQAFERGVVNMHGGPLPAYRGVHGNIHALLNGETTFGAALHFMDEGVDTGDIVGQEYFDVDASDNSYDVFCKTQIAHWNLFTRHIDSILDGTAELIRQADLCANGAPVRIHRMKDVEGLKELDLSMDRETFVRRVRAFDFPGHEPCWIRLDGRKIYLRTRDLGV